MKPLTKMYIVVIVCACVILYQYHLYHMWSVDISQRVEDGDGIDSYAEDLRLHVKKAIVLLKSERVISNDINLKFLEELMDLLNKQIYDQKALGMISSRQPVLPVNTESLDNLPLKNSSMPPRLYIITPTYRRAEQLAELTRMGHTLMHVPNVYWLVIEDAQEPTELVTLLLQKIGLPFNHLTAPMPKQYKQKKVKPRGVSNRNRGLEWLRANASSGVFYFADDDNTYDLEIFDQMRYTKRVSMWPVGLITKYGVSSPIVRNGTLIGFYDGWVASRKFPVDMAGFAVNVEFLHQRPKAKMPFHAGFEEDGFLKSLAPFEPKDIELLACNCTMILTWHTQTKKNDASMALDIKKYGGTNLVELKKILV